MRNLCVAAAVVLGIGIIAIAQEQKIEIKPLPQTGTYVARLQMLQEREGGVDGPSSASAEVVFELSLSATDAGGLKIRIVPKSMKATMNEANGKISTNEKADDDVVIVVLDAKGQVIETSHERTPSRHSDDASADRRPTTRPATNAEGRKAMSMLMPHLLCTPDKPVSVGSHWERAEDSTKASCALKSVANSLARIDASITSSNMRDAGGTKVITDSKQNLSMDYDLKLGLATRFESQIQDDLKVDGGTQYRGPTKMTNKMSISATLTPGAYKDKAATKPAPATHAVERATTRPSQP